MRAPPRLLPAIVAAGALLAHATRAHAADAALSELIEKENLVETKPAAGPWTGASVGQKIPLRDRLRTGELSRAGILFSDKSVLRLDELTTMEIVPPPAGSAKPTLSLENGAVYFFSREKPRELEVRTPAANGALKGTALLVEVRGGVTRLTTLEGQVELSNAQGRVTIGPGEQGVAEPGKAPRKTAVIEAVNLLQWCLYYPAVLDPHALGLRAAPGSALAASMDAYAAGDLLGALAAHPAGAGAGAEGRLYHAAVLLSVGQVAKARTALAGVPAANPGRLALEEMIAAVQLTDWKGAQGPRTSSQWLAHSYFLQSRGQLEEALKAAREAARLSPEFGYAWTRVAELEFSFGRTAAAREALATGLRHAPRNAQAHSLQGFLASAQNRLGEARAAFERAIALDGALGNAWLGRGLCSIRQGRDEEGRRDLQTAAALEPNRSILRSYLGKAFSQTGDNAMARNELGRARELDPNDPTPWLYSALQNKQENRYNAAVRDLEQSIALNNNRRLYRSRFLLDQDRAVRGANLAAIYQNNGLLDQSVREAARAVNADYASAPAHLFLANSYNALRDPTRVLLRYETPWFNELLLANLLSPVGGGPLSQFVSEQEYSKLFEADRLGLSTVTDYFTNGELREVASQYGTAGNLSYALDAEYQYQNGLRPNNHLSRLESYQNFKLQAGPQDTLFFQSKFQDLQTGELFQHYDPREVESIAGDGTRRQPNRPALTQDFRELQDPALLLGGWHHEWAPGVHTLFLLGRLANDQVLTARATRQGVITTDARRLIPARTDAQGFAIPTSLSRREQLEALRGTLGRAPVAGFGSLDFDSDYRANFEAYTAELSQIIEAGPHAFILGGRYQRGTFTTQERFSAPLGLSKETREALFNDPALDQNLSVDFERINLYAYDVWRLTPWLSLTGGITADWLDYPDNFRSPPLNDREASLQKASPKAGFILTPTASTTLRGAYAEAISGSSFDESIRLEPNQVAGFLQAYRTAISEDLVGPVAGSTYRIWGLSLEQKLPTATYLGLEYSMLSQDLDRTIGVFEFPVPGDPSVEQQVFASSLSEKLIYREDSITASLNQLLGERWSLGGRYRLTRSKLRTLRPDLPESVSARDRTEQGTLHELDLYALYNHPSGFFARADALFFNQENDGYAAADDRRTPYDERRPGDSFWQFNVAAGYRFAKNQCELSCTLLNLTGEDYRLNPLNPYSELPRDRTLLVRVKFSF